jgi:hypothetical protein
MLNTRNRNNPMKYASRASHGRPFFLVAYLKIIRSFAAVARYTRNHPRSLTTTNHALWYIIWPDARCRSVLYPVTSILFCARRRIPLIHFLLLMLGELQKDALAQLMYISSTCCAVILLRPGDWVINLLDVFL